MRDDILQRARELLAAKTVRSPGVERAILGGAWDGGILIQGLLDEAEADLMRSPQESIDE